MNQIQILFATASLPVLVFIPLVALACVGVWSIMRGLLRAIADVLSDSMDHKPW